MTDLKISEVFLSFASYRMILIFPAPRRQVLFEFLMELDGRILCSECGCGPVQMPLVKVSDTLIPPLEDQVLLIGSS